MTLLETTRIDLSQPAFVILLDVEATRPRITLTARTEGEADRLAAWIRGQPRLAALLVEAAELAYGPEWRERLLVGDE